MRVRVVIDLFVQSEMDAVLSAHRIAVANNYDDIPVSIEAEHSKAFNNGMLVNKVGTSFSARGIPMRPRAALEMLQELVDAAERAKKTVPLIGEADPELERLLAEEEEIERRVRPCTSLTWRGECVLRGDHKTHQDGSGNQWTDLAEGESVEP